MRKEIKPTTNSDIFTKLNKIDTVKINMNYWDFSFEAGFGSVNSGNRLEIAKSVLDPVPNGLSTQTLGGKIAYNTEYLGSEIKFNYMMFNATKEGYDPLNFYNDLNVYAGLIISPYTFKGNRIWTKFFIHGGLIYNNFSISSEVPGATNFNNASGIGFYGGIGADFLQKEMLIGCSLDYENVSAKYSNYDFQYKLENIVFRINFGYRLEINKK
jgi:hypothetical protein